MTDVKAGPQPTHSARTTGQVGVTGSVTVTVDESQRPLPPQSQLPVGATPRLPLSLTIACQVIVVVNLIAVLATKIHWIGNDRVIAEGLQHVSLLRSFSISKLAPRNGGASTISEILIIVSLLAMCAIAIVSTRALRSFELISLGAWIIAISLFLAGLLRLGSSTMTGSPTWISRAVWGAVALVAIAGALRTSKMSSTDRNGRYDLIIIVAIIGVCVAYPLMLKLGLWNERPKFPGLNEVNETDNDLRSARPWLYLAGLVPLLLVGSLLLVRPPVRRKLTVGFGLLLFGASLVYLGRVGPDRLDASMAAFGPQGNSTSSADGPTPTLAPEVESLPPVPPCVSWAFGEAASEKFVVEGTPCVNGSIQQGAAVVATVALPVSPTDIGTIADPILLTTSQTVPGQIYDGVIVMLERDHATLSVSVVARSTATLEVVWAQGCPVATTTPAVHFSGGQVTRDPQANRTDQELYGLIDYVAISCDEVVVVYNPTTGVSY